MSQENEDYINKRLIYCSLLLQEYGYRELINSPLVKGENKYMCKSKLKYIKNNLLQFARNAGATRQMVQKSEDIAINNVGLMASVMGTLALVPECQIDFIETEFAKICLESMNRFNKTKKLKKDE
tara:strand:+ start:209 stop:583 length:375 start_codon:yes stop_codon:yes gene_type:complete